MSTIASPRPPSLRSPTSSVRTSLDNTTSRPSQPPRRNRTALRDYYNLKETSPTSPNRSTADKPTQEEEASLLDQPTFDASTYVREILSQKGLSEVLQIEAGLVSEIRGLDGEKKALVYDNYSKLITATDTIRKMRTNMDPLTPATKTLQPAISHIAETAAGLSSNIMNERVTPNSARQLKDDAQNPRKTVLWVLDSPRRFAALLAQGKKEDAELQWAEVKHLLNTWDGVKGVEEVRRRCEEALKGEEEEEEESDEDDEDEDE